MSLLVALHVIRCCREAMVAIGCIVDTGGRTVSVEYDVNDSLQTSAGSKFRIAGNPD